MTVTKKKSGRSLRLSHRGLILVAVPLAFELVFVGTLFALLVDSEQRAKKAVSAKQIVDMSDELLRQLLRAASLLVSYTATHEETVRLQYRRTIDEFPARLSIIDQWLRKSHDPRAQAVFDKIKSEWQEVLKVASRIEGMVESGVEDEFDRDRVELLSKLLRSRMVVLLDLQHQLADLEKVNNPVDPAWQDQIHDGIKLTLLFGVFANVLISGWMALYFGRTISGRLQVLTDNSKRVASGRAPNPLLSGDDEIAELDADFHHMLAALDEAAAKERAIVENMPAGLVVVDRAGTVISVNPRMLELTRTSVVPGQMLSDLFMIENVSKAEQMATLFQRALGKVTEVQVDTAGGAALRSLEVSVTELTLGESQRYLVNCLDVTDRHAIEQLKREFLEMVSHDLKTPLTAIRGVLELLGLGKYGTLNEAGTRQVESATRSTDRLMQLVLDLLEIQKAESGKLELDCKNVPVSRIIEQSSASVSALAKRRHLEIIATIEPDHVVRVDEDRIVQVLVNLLSNALKFSPEGQTVAIACREQSDSIEISVSDHGPGLSDEDKAKIFDKFISLRRKNPSEAAGTGLGLSICKSLVELHGGDIGVRGAPGQGSCFWFTVPRAR